MIAEAGRSYLDKSDISRLPDTMGVYFLYQKGAILVYIGKAHSLNTRVPQHNQDKEFILIGYETCHWSRARELEKKLLNLYREEHGQLPHYNKVS